MTAGPLSRAERGRLAEIEEQLRLGDPSLDRLMRRRTGRMRRLAWRPGPLVVAVAVLATAVAALALTAATGSPVAAGPAALGVLALGGVFRRLRRLRGG